MTVGDGNASTNAGSAAALGAAALEKRLSATDRAEWWAHVVGTDPECTAEWLGGARGREAGAGPAMGRSTERSEAQTPA